MTKILGVFFAIAVLFGLTSAPANAAWPLPDPRIYHANDGGYDPAILFDCLDTPDGTLRLHELMDSWNTYECDEVRRVYIRSGEELWCEGPWPWDETEKVLDATGWHLWREGDGRHDCTLRKD